MFRPGRASLLLPPFALLAVACAGIKSTGDYRSAVHHEALPLRTTVAVEIARDLRKDKEDEAQDLEAVRDSLSRAIKGDLQQNGPLTPVGDSPEARLVVTIKAFDHKERDLWIMMWFLAPIWLFGVPMHSANVQLGLDVRLSSAYGDVLYESSRTEKCSRFEGIYYGHEPLTYGCPAREIIEKIRDDLSLSRAEVLGRLERTRPRPRMMAADKPAAPPPVARGPAPVAAVFAIRDMTEKLDPHVLEQLTEFLSVQVAQQLGYKVVPREQLRGQLASAKSETFKACYDESCQIELGKAVAASKSISTTLIRVGNRCAFNATVYDLKTESADGAASADTACDENALLDGVRSVVRGLKTGGN